MSCDVQGQTPLTRPPQRLRSGACPCNRKPESRAPWKAGRRAWLVQQHYARLPSRPVHELCVQNVCAFMACVVEHGRGSARDGLPSELSIGHTGTLMRWACG
eukprot:363318-Chlamydomonas_euryale.AAC.6